MRPEFSLGHSEFNDFLFAVVGEEKSGLQLTVLSALARLGLDPWAEAARLSALSKESATNALSATIATLPEGDWTASEAPSIARRLVSHLPKYLPSGNRSSQGPADRIQMVKSEALKWSIWALLVVAAVYGISRWYWD